MTSNFLSNDTFGNDVKNNEHNSNSTTKAETNEKENSEKYDYVMMLKNSLDRSLFPNDFDTWTMSEQYKWINNNLSKLFPNVPVSLLESIPAFFHQDFNRSPLKKPEWLDINKYRRGQKFVQNHLLTLTMTTLVALLHAYTFEQDLKPIILGGQSHTPYLSLKRNMSTMKRMMNWFNGDPWIEGTPAYKDMQYTRKMHLMAREKMSRLSENRIAAACTFANPWCPDRNLLLKDFAAACPSEKVGQRPYKLFAKLADKWKYLNDAGVSITQCCFAGMIILHPRKFGAHDATDEDLEAFCHIWRCYGYFLGIKDEYNFCRGSLEEVQQRMRDFYQYWVLPNFKEVTPEWEHVTRCIIEPFNYSPVLRMSYKAAVLLTIDPFDVKMPHLYASLSYFEWFVYYCWKFILCYAMKLNSVTSFFNKLISSAQMDLKEDPEKEAQLHQRSMKQVPDFSIAY